MNVIAMKPQLPQNENDLANFHLFSYVINWRSNACVACGAIHDYSDVQEVHLNPAKPGTRLLRPALQVQDGYDIDTIAHQETFVPRCHECIPVGHTKSFSSVNPLSMSAWADTVRRKQAEVQEAKTAARTAAKAPHVPSLDDL